MEPDVAETAIKTFLGIIRKNLESAATIAKAAVACADGGNIGKSVEIALDVEQLIYEANTLLNAASLINRISYD
jgi:hypothetical protein